MTRLERAINATWLELEDDRRQRFGSMVAAFFSLRPQIIAVEAGWKNNKPSAAPFFTIQISWDLTCQRLREAGLGGKAIWTVCEARFGPSPVAIFSCPLIIATASGASFVQAQRGVFHVYTARGATGGAAKPK